MPDVLAPLATFFRDYGPNAVIAVFVAAWAWERRENKKKELRFMELALASQRARLKTVESLRAVNEVLKAIDGRLGIRALPPPAPDDEEEQP